MEKVLIIAEAGVNHNGSLEIAKKLADTAKKCGADIVKYQTAVLESLVTKNGRMADYQKDNIGKDVSQREMLKNLLLTFDEFKELASYCEEIGIHFLSTPFDCESIDFLDELGCDIWKIPSSEITNYPYLVKIAKTHKPIILSTGMCTMEEVRAGYETLKENGADDIILLHCTSQYPTEYSDVNLNAMLTLKNEFHCTVGYSDHTRGVEVPVAAVAMGARVVEKHFTLDKNMVGPDHKASLDPEELKTMIDMVRNVEMSMGSNEKKPTEIELSNLLVQRKSIVAATNIKAGEIFTADNLTTKRPGSGISPMLWNEIIGTKAKRDYEEDDLIEM